MFFMVLQEIPLSNLHTNIKQNTKKKNSSHRRISDIRFLLGSRSLQFYLRAYRPSFLKFFYFLFSRGHTIAINGAAWIYMGSPSRLYEVNSAWTWFNWKARRRLVTRPRRCTGRARPGTRSMSQRAGEHGLLSRVEKSIDLPSDVSN